MTNLVTFEHAKIRKIWHDEQWHFSVIDIVAALTDQSNYQVARKYWNKLAERLKKEGSEVVTNCHRLKLEATNGKRYMTDEANIKTLLRLIQSIPYVCLNDTLQ